MDKYSYNSELVKAVFEKDSSSYNLDDWKFLAEFHEYHHRKWIETSLSLIRDTQLHRLAFDKLYKHFIARFGALPSRKKIKGLLSLTRGRPPKKVEHERIRKLIFPLKEIGMTDEKALEHLIHNNMIEEMDIRTFRRIKNKRK